MNEKIALLEARIGTKHILVDDWNALGWEFSNDDGDQRVCYLTNYTECKAEGGSVFFTISDEGRIQIISGDGSGPHGIPWWDEILVDGMEVVDINAFADALMKACYDESQSSYWTPWRDEKPQRNLLFKEKKTADSEETLVEVPFTSWTEADWNESMSRAE